VTQPGGLHRRSGLRARSVRQCQCPLKSNPPAKIVRMPAVLGHEVAGIVAEVGPDVAQFRVGDHVVGSLAQSCGSCARCLSGRSFQCLHPESTLRRPIDPPRLSRHGVGLFQGLALGCGVVTGAAAVLNTAQVSAGDTVVIFGAGGVGLNAISGALIAGASSGSVRFHSITAFTGCDASESEAAPTVAVSPVHKKSLRSSFCS
jgi:D-arabinose 1-dehydrogenase-like Zn-dependent alcohol dehydrogenase